MLFLCVEVCVLQELGVKKYENVLVIGVGLGYFVVLFVYCMQYVMVVEIDLVIVKFVEDNLCNDGVINVEVVFGDGLCGWVVKVLYDVICVVGGLLVVLQEMFEQFKVGGCLLVFVGGCLVMKVQIIMCIDDKQYCVVDVFEMYIDYFVNVIELLCFKF